MSNDVTNETFERWVSLIGGLPQSTEDHTSLARSLFKNESVASEQEALAEDLVSWGYAVKKSPGEYFGMFPPFA